MKKQQLKVALVCDWLTVVGGAEKVLLAFHEMYPEAPIYTSQYNEKGIDWFKGCEIHTGWLQKLPSSMRRFIPFLRQKYFQKLDLSDYDLVISVTGAEAKGIKTKKADGTGAYHISYCHVPTQYYWQMYDQYLENPGFGFLNPLARLMLKLIVKPLRKWDYQAAQRPDQFVTISEYAAEQIKKYYNRDSIVVWPPVELEKFQKAKQAKKNDEVGFITTSRQVNWKRLDICIEACVKAKQKLTIIGEGPEHKNLVKLAEKIDKKGLIEFVPRLEQEELGKYLAQAKAYLFPSLEPFGIAPVEALAVGTPVIAYGKGGALDYIQDGKNGLIFESQNAKSMAAAICLFNEKYAYKFDKKSIMKSAEKFDIEMFKQKMEKVVDEAKIQ